jgi:hypothetical protein
MTNSLKLVREIGEGIRQAGNGRELILTGKVLARYRNSKKIKVQLPNGDEKGEWCRWAMPQAATGKQDGTMPAVGSHVLIFDLSPPGKKYSNLVAGLCLFDETNTAPDGDSDATDDVDYQTITAANGDSVEFFTKDGTNHLKIKSSGKLNIIVDGEVNVVCDTIRLGGNEDSQVEEIVLKSHFALYDDLISDILSVLQAMSTGVYIDGLLGALPMAALCTTLFTELTTKIATLPTRKDNNQNITTKTKADK